MQDVRSLGWGTCKDEKWEMGHYSQAIDSYFKK